jgi:hypothetical protein
MKYGINFWLLGGLLACALSTSIVFAAFVVIIR